MPNFADPNINSAVYIGTAEGARQVVTGRKFKPEKVLAVSAADFANSITIKSQLSAMLAGASGETMASSIIAQTVGDALYLMIADRMGLISKRSAEVEGGGTRGKDAAFMDSFVLAGTDVVIARALEYTYNKMYSSDQVGDGV